MHANQQDSGRHPPVPFLYPAVFLISATGIAYQVTLMRVLSIAQWHHFAYMIISIAMLGYGASGTLLTLIRARLAGRERAYFFVSLLLLAISMPFCYAWSQRIPFETFHLVTQRDQFGWLLALYAILAAPFFLASTCITLALFMMPRRVGRVYFTDLLGSGIGAAAVVTLLFYFPPDQLPYLLGLLLTLLAGAVVFRTYPKTTPERRAASGGPTKRLGNQHVGRALARRRNGFGIGFSPHFSTSMGAQV